jgi:MFS family permease
MILKKSQTSVHTPEIRLGVRENLAQFTLLVVVNAFVWAIVGMERSILPAIAEHEFALAAKSAILAFIAVFGVTKALTNYLAGRLSDRYGRKHVLVAGWIIATPVPFLLMWAPSWSWVLAANILLGISQGLTWSTTVIMKIDLAGPRNRGLAMGLNEFAGYFAVAAAAWATGWIAAHYGLRPEPFYLGVAFVAAGLVLSVWAVTETRHHAAHEARTQAGLQVQTLSQAEIFRRTSVTDPDLSSISQAGLVNNLNDGMAWGLFPLVFAAAGMDLAQGWYPCRSLPNGLGAAAARHRSLVRPDRAKMVDCLGHVDPDNRHCPDRTLGKFRRFCWWRHPAGGRHRYGLSHAPGRNRRRGAPELARVGGRRLPPVA